MEGKLYQIGDKVVVREDATGIPGFVHQMTKNFGGSTVTIDHIGQGEEYYLIKEDHHTWYWVDGMFVGPAYVVPPSFNPNKKTLPSL